MSPGPAVGAAGPPARGRTAAGRGPAPHGVDEISARADARRRARGVREALLARVLAETKGNVSRAAERLGLDRTTLHRKMKALGLDGE